MIQTLATLCNQIWRTCIADFARSRPKLLPCSKMFVTSLLASHTVHPVVSSLATECSVVALQNSLKLLPQLRLSAHRALSSHHLPPFSAELWFLTTRSSSCHNSGRLPIECLLLTPHASIQCMSCCLPYSGRQVVRALTSS